MAVKPLLGEDLQPSAQKQLSMELARLSSDPRFIPIVHLGGGLSPADIAENQRRRQARNQEETRLIMKYGQRDHFLELLRGSLALLQEQIETVQGKIEALEEAK